MLCWVWQRGKDYQNGTDAATAVEFALVSIPFVFLLIGIIEMSLMFAASSILQGATTEAARIIRTGQAQTGGTDPQEAFETALCNHADSFLNCAQIEYEVVTMDGGFTDFSEFPVEYDPDGNFVSRGFTPGGVNDVVLIRTLYRYPLMTPFIGSVLSNGPNNTRLMISTVIMENEPYDFSQVAGQL